MQKISKIGKNILNCNKLIISGMYKRRKMTIASITNICDGKTAIRVVK